MREHEQKIEEAAAKAKKEAEDKEKAREEGIVTKAASSAVAAFDYFFISIEQQLFELSSVVWIRFL